MSTMPLLFPLVVWSLAASGLTPEPNRTGASDAYEPANGR